MDKCRIFEQNQQARIMCQVLTSHANKPTFPRKKFSTVEDYTRRRISPIRGLGRAYGNIFVAQFGANNTSNFVSRNNNNNKGNQVACNNSGNNNLQAGR
ncbi:hypothetical protein CR513_27478, partial [Mucuna pruriens]